jgi:hypothetical protein
MSLKFKVHEANRVMGLLSEFYVVDCCEAFSGRGVTWGGLTHASLEIAPKEDLGRRLQYEKPKGSYVALASSFSSPRLELEKKSRWMESPPPSTYESRMKFSNSLGTLGTL